MKGASGSVNWGHHNREKMSMNFQGGKGDICTSSEVSVWKTSTFQRRQENQGFYTDDAASKFGRLHGTLNL